MTDFPKYILAKEDYDGSYDGPWLRMPNDSPQNILSVLEDHPFRASWIAHTFVRRNKKVLSEDRIVKELIEDAVKDERKACVRRIKMVEYLAIEELTEALESAVEEKTQERG